VAVFDETGGATSSSFQAFGGMAWGANVAGGNVVHDFLDEILAGPGPGPALGPHVRGFDRDGWPVPGLSYFAYGTLQYGVNVAAASVDGIDADEMLAAPGPGAVFGPHVRGFSLAGSTISALAKLSFFAYGTLRYGAVVDAGRLDGDASAEILTAPGPGPPFGPTVRGWNYDGVAVGPIAAISFDAFSVAQYGARVAGGDVEGDGYAEIVAAPGPGAGASFPARIRGFDYDATAVAALAGFDVIPFGTRYGARPGLGDVMVDGREELLAAPGPDPSAGAHVQTYDYAAPALSPRLSFVAFPGSGYGVNVTGARLGL
jgi:hypothetical protein